MVNILKPSPSKAVTTNPVADRFAIEVVCGPYSMALYNVNTVVISNTQGESKCFLAHLLADDEVANLEALKEIGFMSHGEYLRVRKYVEHLIWNNEAREVPSIDKLLAMSFTKERTEELIRRVRLMVMLNPDSFVSQMAGTYRKADHIGLHLDTECSVQVFGAGAVAVRADLLLRTMNIDRKSNLSFRVEDILLSLHYFGFLLRAPGADAGMGVMIRASKRATSVYEFYVLQLEEGGSVG